MYKIYFSQVKTIKKGILPDLYLPVLPEKLQESGEKDNQKHDLLAVGEVVRPGERKLKTWEIDSLYEDGQEMSVEDFRQYIEDMAESAEKFHFFIVREREDGTVVFQTKVWAVLESYSFEDRAGEIGDIYYTLKLREYREHEGKMLG